MVITARTSFLIFLATLFVVTIGVDVGIVAWHAPAAPPEPPGPCVESAEFRRPAESRFECPAGARIETYPAGPGMFLAKCVCPPAAPPASTDAAARGGD